MHYLPPEIIGHIIDLLVPKNRYRDVSPTPKLAPLAAINNDWRRVVESRIWQKLTLKDSDLADFQFHMATKPARRRSLRTLEIGWNDLFATDIDHNVTADKRLEAFENEERRLNEMILAIWGELASWDEDLAVSSLKLRLDGARIYDLLGPLFRGWTSSMDEIWSTWKNRKIINLPSLPSVTTFDSFWNSGWDGIDVWAAAMAISVAASLPQLQIVTISGSDLEMWWPTARKHFRDDLAARLASLPISVQELSIRLPFTIQLNQEKEPANLLSNGKDLMSLGLREASYSLTTLVLEIGQLSPELFWPANENSSSHHTLFARPHLQHLAVTTSVETAAGRFCLLGADSRYPHPLTQMDPDTLASPGEDLTPEDWADLDDPEEVRDRDTGQYPIRSFRIRPEHGYFDSLAISIAKAASCMPKLRSLTWVLDSLNGRLGSRSGEYGGYMGGGAAIDIKDLPNPRIEWVFHCPERQLLGWKQPEEASRLWKEKCPGIDIDILTCEYTEEGDETNWERWREGSLIDLDD